MPESLVAAPANLGELINLLTQIVIFSTPFAILLLFFFWNVFQLIMTTGDVEKRKKARESLVFGIIILFVVFTVAGLVAVLQATFFGQDAVSRSFRITAPPAPAAAPSEPAPATDGGGGGSGNTNCDPGALSCPEDPAL